MNASQRVALGKLQGAFLKAGWRPPPLDEGPADRLLDDMQATKPSLPPREYEVLRLAADGLLTREMAAKMDIGYERVKEHLKQARWKLGANNTAHAVAILMRRGEL